MILIKIAYSYVDEILRFINLAFLGKDPQEEEIRRLNAINKLKIIAFKAIDDKNYEFVSWILQKENVKTAIKTVMAGEEFIVPPIKPKTEMPKYTGPDADIKSYLFDLTYEITDDDIKRYKRMAEEIGEETDKERIERHKDNFLIDTFGEVNNPKSKNYIKKKARRRTKSQWDVF